jgi:hypothetical protein
MRLASNSEWNQSPRGAEGMEGIKARIGVDAAEGCCGYCEKKTDSAAPATLGINFSADYSLPLTGAAKLE